MSCPLSDTSRIARVIEQTLLSIAQGFSFNRLHRIPALQVLAGILIVNCQLSSSYQKSSRDDRYSRGRALGTFLKYILVEAQIMGKLYTSTITLGFCRNIMTLFYFFKLSGGNGHSKFSALYGKLSKTQFCCAVQCLSSRETQNKILSAQNQKECPSLKKINALSFIR